MLTDGFLGINKPAGCTSHDVVDRIRRVFGIKKVGHTGTLDPMATGVLVMCLGKFTRLSQYVTATDKKYRAEITFGIQTDTLDAEGEVVGTSTDLPASADVIEKALEQFRGEITQVPPMHSAVRVGGKRLYELAREGHEIARPERSVKILDLDIRKYEPPKLQLDVWCSKGTYIRTLASDLGEAVGCGAHLSGLVRTAVGKIDLSQCFNLDDLEDPPGAEVFLPVTDVLDLPTVKINPDQIHTYVNGQALRDVAGVCEQIEQMHCVFDLQNQFLGMGRWSEDGLRPVCVIAERES